jgi:hypothetical protein
MFLASSIGALSASFPRLLWMAVTIGHRPRSGTASMTILVTHIYRRIDTE